jgi:hypothetical protein
LAAVALAAVGLGLGTILSGAPSNAILGTVAVLLAAGAAIYRPPLGLAILVFVYPFDLTTYAGPVKLTTSAVLIGVLMLVLVGRQILANPPAIAHSPLDIPVLIFAAASVLSLAAQTGNLSGQLVGLLKAGGGFLIFFIATQVVRALADALLVVGSVIATGLIQAMGALLPFVTGNRSVSLDAPATGTLIDANLFAGYLVLVIPLLLALGVAEMGHRANDGSRPGIHSRDGGHVLTERMARTRRWCMCRVSSARGKALAYSEHRRRSCSLRSPGRVKQPNRSTARAIRNRAGTDARGPQPGVECGRTNHA